MHISIAPTGLTEGLKIAAIGGVAGIVSAALTGVFNYSSKVQETQVELVKIGIGILRADPKESQTIGAREWALDLIQKNTGVTFSQKARAELLSTKLDFQPYLNDFQPYERPRDDAHQSPPAMQKQPKQEPKNTP